ncbi:MAG TPA: di-heme oxidoredictase family protein [Thermoanaerobaculia bacterium]|nr:di-heme oxidoredictase family protein [Thermoanaerobaculia bacterium]
MKRPALVLVLCALTLATSVEAQRRRAVNPPTPVPPPPVVNTQFGGALPGLSAENIALFNNGRRAFVDGRIAETGLGPVYNGRACLECHGIPAGGGGSGRTVYRIASEVDGVYDDLKNLGGSMLQSSGIGMPGGPDHRFFGERIPESANIVAKRRAQPLFGLGLVDATDDATFIALAAAQAARNDGTAGRVALVQNIIAGMKTVGKFGWKAQIATLQQFAADAYLNEMGITNPMFPAENCPSGNCDELKFNPQPVLNDDGTNTNALADFMRFLGAPPRGLVSADSAAGEAVFSRIGCDSCHVPSLQTAANANPALNRVTYQPYSDFLLHDMGALGDRIVQDDAGPREMRTPPLWGLRGTGRFLHDGRASTMEAAIEAHDGQGLGAATRFKALNATERAQLIAFLRSL